MGEKRSGKLGKEDRSEYWGYNIKFWNIFYEILAYKEYDIL